MAQLRDIKNRIVSVQKTRKMTQAMKMVAASKFKRASEKAVNSRAYIDQLESLLMTLQDQSDTFSSPLLSSNNADKEAIIVISGDRGLCGGFNSNLIKKVKSNLDTSNKQDYFFWGVKVYQAFKRQSLSVEMNRDGFNDKSTVDDIKKALKPIVDGYISGKYSSVKVVYTEFKSIVSSVPVIKQVLPIKVEKTETVTADYFIEPSSEKVLNLLAEDYVNLLIYRSVIESFASEQGARMAAMDAATDNAGEMINVLKLQYNRQRQAQITTELSEIVAGAEALVQ